jgi:hypothetical protein
MPKDKLLDICCPHSLGDGKQDMATKTLNRWVELGLFVLADSEEIRVADEYRSKLRKANATATSIAEVVRAIVLSPSNNSNFWGDEENRASDFTRAACWMLAQDIHQFIPTSYSQVERKALEQAESAEVVLFQNDTRWSGYVSWAAFLGFGRSESGKASGGFVTDPTPAIRHTLVDLLPKSGDIAINDLLEALAQSIPVMDGGEYRRRVEEKLRPEKWKVPNEGEISTSLSRALLRLRDGGEIRLEKKADFDVQVRLIGKNERVAQEVTHATRGPAK